MVEIQDYQQRALALDANQSFIVQAPAGSGKTALLVYRMLVLLARVERVEHVLAITFTRKATAEMKERLFELLQKAQDDVVVSDKFERQGIMLAKQVLVRNEQYHWQLMDNPSQLQIHTIDAFCQKLCGHMPWFSRLGGKANATEDAHRYYVMAIEETFKELTKTKSELKEPLLLILQELNFNYFDARQLFSQMLARRDQWMRYLVHNNLGKMQDELETAWQRVINQHLQQLSKVFDASSLDECIQAIQWVRESVLEDEPEHDKLNLFNILIKEKKCTLSFWVSLKELLLTEKGECRKRLNKNDGFLVKHKEEKKLVLKLIEQCETKDDVLPLLQQLSHLPSKPFSQQDWHQLFALERVLKHMASILVLYFNQYNECDHTEVAMRANWALSQLEQPTDLALKLDYHIQHILVDEFQDTSHAQLQLLKNLTTAWQIDSRQDNDKSLFLVGDPMQSIYRFREADVGLFVQVANNSTTQVFDNIDIQFLQLSENFRSNADLVNWFNYVFGHSFPKQDNVFEGAIRYSQATTHQIKEGLEKKGHVHKSIETVCLSSDQTDSELAQARKVAECCQHFLQSTKQEEKCAILVRSKNHLTKIISVLEEQKIQYTGVDIFPLNELPAIQDILVLTKAICRLSDRVAWFALLRSPWLGLCLDEVSLFSARTHSIWQQIEHYVTKKQTDLSQNTQARLMRFYTLMKQVLKQRQKVSLAILTKWAWQSLGGESTLMNASMSDVQACFDLIRHYEKGADIPSFIELEKAVAKLYAKSNQDSTCRVFLSTIHKAKGLQYHTVIVPSLSRRPPNQEKQIMSWGEVSYQQGGSHLLLAPFKQNSNKSEEKEATHHDYLISIEKIRAKNEAIRLLYVACTRAEKKLILFASAKLDEKEQKIKPPEKNSLISYIWPVICTDVAWCEGECEEGGVGAQTDITKECLDQTLLRIPESIQVNLKPSIQWTDASSLKLRQEITAQSDAPVGKTLEYDWASELARSVGVVMHHILSVYQSDILTLRITDSVLGTWKKILMINRCPDTAVEKALNRLEKGIRMIQKDKKAAFIFRDYEIQNNEYDITSIENNELKRYRLDRTFVDNDDVRWVVDYKTTYTEQSEVAHFATQQVEQRHRGQLEKYAEQLFKMDARKIKLAVYFPMLSQLICWDYFVGSIDEK